MKTSNSAENSSRAFLLDNFDPKDRLAVVLVNKRCGDVIRERYVNCRFGLFGCAA
jgi:hypothetical protein